MRNEPYDEESTLFGGKRTLYDDKRWEREMMIALINVRLGHNSKNASMLTRAHFKLRDAIAQARLTRAEICMETLLEPVFIEAALENMRRVGIIKKSGDHWYVLDPPSVKRICVEDMIPYSGDPFSFS